MPPDGVVLGYGRCPAGQCGADGCVGVDAIGLADPAPFDLVGSIDLDHGRAAWRAAHVNPRLQEEVPSSTPTALTVPRAFRNAIAAAYPVVVVGNSASATWPPPVGDDSNVNRVRVGVHSAEHRIHFCGGRDRHRHAVSCLTGPEVTPARWVRQDIEGASGQAPIRSCSTWSVPWRKGSDSRTEQSQDSPAGHQSAPEPRPPEPATSIDVRPSN